MRFMGASGIALSGSLTGLILFTLTIREFGFAKFRQIIFDKMALYLALFLLSEVIILLLFKGYLIANF